MCRRIDCPKCGRPTFAGCGRHVEQVLGNVPPAQRCQCRDDGRDAKSPAEPGRGARSWLRALLGK
jgi:hypothetical protein